MEGIDSGVTMREQVSEEEGSSEFNSSNEETDKTERFAPKITSTRTDIQIEQGTDKPTPPVPKPTPLVHKPTPLVPRQETSMAELLEYMIQQNTKFDNKFDELNKNMNEQKQESRELNKKLDKQDTKFDNKFDVLNKSVNEQKQDMNKKFSEQSIELDKKFEKQNDKLDELTTRFEEQNKKLDEQKQAITDLNKNLEGQQTEIKVLEEKIELNEKKLTDKWDEKVKEVEDRAQDLENEFKICKDRTEQVVSEISNKVEEQGDRIKLLEENNTTGVDIERQRREITAEIRDRVNEGQNIGNRKLAELETKVDNHRQDLIHRFEVQNQTVNEKIEQIENRVIRINHRDEEGGECNVRREQTRYMMRDTIVNESLLPQFENQKGVSPPVFLISFIR